MNYDPFSGTHDNLPDEHPIDKAKRLVSEHLKIIENVTKEAKAAGATRAECYQLIHKALKETIMDYGADRTESYIMALIAIQLDL